MKTAYHLDINQKKCNKNCSDKDCMLIESGAPDIVERKYFSK